MGKMGDYTVSFAPNQKLPPGYTVQWWVSDEMFRWVIDDNTYGPATWDRFAARRMAWAHYAANRDGGKDG